MKKEPLFEQLLDEFSTNFVPAADLPYETAESTLKAMWHTALNNPCSARKAETLELGALPPDKITIVNDLIKQRLSGIPLARLTGRINFMGIELIYEPEVLIPRPETELLGTTAVQMLGDLATADGPLVMLEIGCGCGNLSCGIASAMRNLQVFAVDCTDSCVVLAKKNVEHLVLSEHIAVFKGDMFAPLESKVSAQSVDAIISNPPYIPSNKLQKDLSHLLVHEPKEAFDGGAFGFSIHQRLIKESLRFLKPNCYLMFEFGKGQEKQVRALFNRQPGYSKIYFVNDQDGIPRVVVAQKGE